MEIVKLETPDLFLKYIRIKNDSLENKMWSDHALTIEGFEEIYSTYQTFLVYDQKKIIGGYLLLEQDFSYWSDEENKENAFYIHKLFVLPQFNGRGYSRKIVEEIKQYAKIMHKDYVRLDCRRFNEKLNTLYEMMEFKFKREFDSSFSGPMNLREYKV